MNLSHRLRLLLVAIVFLSVSQVSAQAPQCKDTLEHKRLQKEMWGSCGQEDTAVVYNACKAYQQHAKADGDNDAYYNAWVCRIVYNLDRMNIRDAYHDVQLMKGDLLYGQKGKDEQFLFPNMLGQVYNACGNVSGASREFIKAIELIKGTRYEKTGLSTLYLGMAHIYMNSKYRESMHWINEDIEEVERHKELPRYHRNLANAYAFKAMTCFKLHDISQFWACQKLALEHDALNNTGEKGSFMLYLSIYQMALENQYDSVYVAIERIPNHKDRYIVKSDILRYQGNYEKAFTTQRRLMHIRDSVTGITIAENIENMDEEINLIKAEQAATKRANIILTIAFVLALLMVIALVMAFILRMRYQRKLVEKNRQLEIANRQARAADEMKTEFIRNVSHEIRTPLNIINGFTQVMMGDVNAVEPEERQKVVETIGDNTRQITSLVNKMLALANESSKDLLKDVEDTDALDICRKAIESMPSVDPDKVKVMLEDQTGGMGTILCTNGDSLLQMLDCLLDNAAKFTEQGYVKLTLRKEKEHMLFTVEDTGCGIRADKVDSIFDRFMKVDEFKQGLGLGLAYCKETVEKLGGTLTLDKTSEEGTAFTLTLPIKLKTQ